MLEIYKFEKFNSSISFCPKRGGLITSIKLNGNEILFLNQETFLDLGKNVRGGIPIMFPNAGPIIRDGKNSKIKDLKQHGFARNMEFDFEILENYFVMTLKSNEYTKKLFDYDFELNLIGEIFEDKIKITQKIKNLSSESIPISPGLHPYFFVKNEEKSKANIFIEYYGNVKDFSFCEGNTVILENFGEIEVKNKFTLNFSKNYNNVWIRSEKGKDFICIEPVYKNENALITDPYLLEKNGEIEFFMIIGN